MALARLLLEGGDRHVSAEALHGEAQAAGIGVSLATVYNTLNQFAETGLVRQVVVDPGRTYFDTNMTQHQHFFFEGDGRLQDIPGAEVTIASLPQAPKGTQISRVDVIVRLSGHSHSKK
jgi:Fur family iron response transcriptional regulator